MARDAVGNGKAAASQEMGGKMGGSTGSIELLGFAAANFPSLSSVAQTHPLYPSQRTPTFPPAAERSGHVGETGDVGSGQKPLAQRDSLGATSTTLNAEYFKFSSSIFPFLSLFLLF